MVVMWFVVMWLCGYVVISVLGQVLFRCEYTYSTITTTHQYIDNQLILHYQTINK